MKRRYVTISNVRMDDDWYGIENTEIERNITVYERERQPQETGLLDKHGTRLYAINDPEPIGFIHFKEQS